LESFLDRRDRFTYGAVVDETQDWSASPCAVPREDCLGDVAR
jgi:hypothetical protein